MNKTKNLIVAALLAVASLAQAKDYHLIIKPTCGKPSGSGGNTKVFVDKTTYADTIVVVPGKNVTELTVTLMGFDGEALSSYILPVDTYDTFTFVTPELPEGFLVEVKDNNGVVYTGIESEE